jgi:hypothetical protein
LCVWINTAKYLYKHPCVCCNFSYFDFLTLVERLSGKKIFQLIITEMKKLYIYYGGTAKVAMRKEAGRMTSKLSAKGKRKSSVACICWLLVLQKST